jgi:nicotinamidase/pyrazinamidase
LIPVINDLSLEFDLVCTTQDWHRRIIVASRLRTQAKKISDWILIDGQEQILWPVHCVQNTYAELAAELHPKVISGGVRIRVKEPMSERTATADSSKTKENGQPALTNS